MTPRRFGAAPRTLTLWAIGVASAWAVVIAGIMSLSGSQSVATRLANRAGPAQVALQDTMVATVQGQASLMVSVQTQDAPTRASAIAAAQTFGQAQDAGWVAYLKVALSMPGERALQQVYEASNAKARQLGAQVVVSDPKAATFATLVAQERTEADVEPATLAKLQAIYTPIVGGSGTTIAAGIGHQTTVVVGLSLILSFFFTLVMLVLLRGARRDQRLLTAEASELRTAGQRGEFEASLQRGLDMEPTEEATFEIVQQALMMAVPEVPVELLLADSSRAHFRQVLSTVTTTEAACPVGVPNACPVASSGQMQVFEDSERLDTCRFLRGGERVWAVCAPVSVAGRSTGVLHAQQRNDVARSDRLPVDLAVIARKTGERIGAVRVLARTEAQAQTDPLTGLPNRRTLDTKIQDLLTEGADYVVAFADLDHFKVINDTYGHEIGDRALRLFARVLRDAIRPSDFVARQGGEEFLVVLPDCSLPDARLVAERVRTELTRALAQAEVPPFTVTIGLTRSEAGDAFSEVVARADAAMLKAKSLGRDRVLAAGDVMPPATQPRSPDGDEVVPGDAVFPAGESMLRPVPAVVGSIRISPEDDPPRDGVLEHHTVA